VQPISDVRSRSRHWDDIYPVDNAAPDAASELDTVENLDACWVLGDRRPVVGRAVLQHPMRISAGNCLTW
jgi:hypothetical protein